MTTASAWGFIPEYPDPPEEGWTFEVRVAPPGPLDDPEWTAIATLPATGVSARQIAVWFNAGPRGALGQALKPGSLVECILVNAEGPEEVDSGQLWVARPEWSEGNVKGHLIAVLSDAVNRDRRLSHWMPFEVNLAFEALSGLSALWFEHELWHDGRSSAADQCADLYSLLNTLGLPVA